MGFLSSLFKQKKTQEELLPINIPELIKADMHSHILPGIDDGAKNIDQSIELIEGLQEIGFSHVLCTPHVMSDFYRNSTETIKEKLDVLRNEIDKRNIKISSVCKFEFVDTVKSKNIDQNDKNLVLELLVIDLIKNKENYEINLIFSNNAYITLFAEIIEATLEDQNQKNQ